MSENIETINSINIIEYLRDKMHALAASYGLTHPQVLAASQLLDSEISRYYRRQRNS